ncbi:MAG: hypothetical protein ACLPSF_01585 [Methylocella sp.]
MVIDEECFVDVVIKDQAVAISRAATVLEPDAGGKAALLFLTLLQARIFGAEHLNDRCPSSWPRAGSAAESVETPRDQLHAGQIGILFVNHR